MVAQVDTGILEDGWYTPGPDLFDSDGVRMALETARSLEAQGDLRGAARWIGRAADEAEKGGNEERVLVLALAAADLTNMIEFGPEAAATPHAGASSLPTIHASGESEREIPSSSPPATPPPTVSYVSELSGPTDPSLTPVTRMSVMRVAIAGPVTDAKSFSVERLETGESSPQGTIEAVLMLIGASEGRIEKEPFLRFVAGVKTKP
jgi:hypothetical protein